MTGKGVPSGGAATAGRTRPAEARPLPVRSCVACRTARPKRELIRIVRRPDGTIAIDGTGRQPGRGAYLCQDAACFDLAGRRRALAHALKTQIPADIESLEGIVQHQE